MKTIAPLQNIKLAIHFGALADPLINQVKAQGYRYPPGIDYLQGCADMITRLKVALILSDGEAEKARRRLLKRLTELILKGENQ
ncbi:MAG: hypothetical protein WC329_04460 [Candidatus Omnitrophota bacterium]|jgi:hypothetical protein